MSAATLHQCVTDKILDKTIKIILVPQLNQTDVPFLAFGFDTSGPKGTVVNANVRMNYRVQCVGQSTKIDWIFLRDWFPFSFGGLALRWPLRVVISVEKAVFRESKRLVYESLKRGCYDSRQFSFDAADAVGLVGA